jgi:hypothetical protein
MLKEKAWLIRRLWRGFDTNVEAVTQKLTTEWRAFGAFIDVPCLQALAATIGTRRVGRHFATQAGGFALGSERADRVGFGPERIGM